MTENNEHKNMLLFNNLQNFGLRKLTPVEQNLWWTIANIIKDKGTHKIIISRQEIEQDSNYDTSNRSTENFKRDMRSMAKKIVSLNTGFKEINPNTGEEADVIFALFPFFKVYNNRVELAVSEYFKSWFNNITSNYSLIDFSVIINLNSRYAKELYRFLMRFKNSNLGQNNLPGFWLVKYDRFKELMNVPEKYNMFEINRKILQPAIKELTIQTDNHWAPFEELNINVVYDKYKKRNVDRLEFSFRERALPNRIDSSTNKELQSSKVLIDNSKNEQNTVNNVDNNYASNFSTQYVDDQSMKVETFKKFLNTINFYSFTNVNNKYFSIRKTAKKDLINLYSVYVDNSDDENNIYSDMSFIASVEYIIKRNKPMKDWQLEEAMVDLSKDSFSVADLFPNSFNSRLTKSQQNKLSTFLSEIIVDDFTI